MSAGMIEVGLRLLDSTASFFKEISDPSEGLRKISSLSDCFTNKPTTARPSLSTAVIVSKSFLITFEGVRMDSMSSWAVILRSMPVRSGPSIGLSAAAVAASAL